MAIDTASKRRSISAYTGLLIAPVADGTIGAADRAALAWLYSGLDYAATTTRTVALTLRARPSYTLATKPAYRLRAKPTYRIEED